MCAWTSNNAVNLYLIGFMGVGKSAVGRYLSKELKMQFIDSDRAIEDKAGMSISAIFERFGEPAFRQMERDFIESGHPANGCIVSCGGGLPIEHGMRELLLSRGVVICLFASENTIIKRTATNNKRPLLNVEDPVERIRKLMDKRMPIYMNTGTGISTENRNLPENASHVIRVYKNESAAFLAKQSR